MASIVKSKLAQVTNRSTSDPDLKQEAEKYRLLVTAGPSYSLDSHKTVHVNAETPTFIENEFIRAKINVRVRGFKGLPSGSPSTAAYFEDPMHHKDQYSLGFSFVPKQDIPSLNTVWGNDLDHPIRDRIPPGFNTAFKIVKEFIDPGLSCDVYADQPWLYGPSLSCWFALRIGEQFKEDQDFPAPGVLSEGADGSGTTLRENLHLPANNEKRRKHFLTDANRQAFTFEKGRLYQGDFYNPYLDFANFALKLPGFSLKVIKYIGEKTHCLRYVFKNRETGDVYFNVNFTLLWGEQLQKALKQEDGGRGLGGAEVSGSHGAEQRTQGESVDGTDEGYNKTQRHGSGSEIAEDREADPSIMRLHPGDHGATAEATRHDTAVDEIDQLLKKTSTVQKRGGLFLDEVD